MVLKTLLEARSVVRAFYAKLLCPQECILCKAKTGGALPVCDACKTEELLLPLRFRLQNPHKFCRLCGRLLISETEYCVSCRAQTENGTCGGTVEGKPAPENTVCNKAVPFYDRVFTLYPYQGRCGEILRRWKNRNVLALAELFGELVFRFIRELDGLRSLKIVPVPPRPKKLKVKGWDQIADLSVILQYRYGLEIVRCLYRADGLSQKSLSRKERETNLKGKIGVKNNTDRLPDTLIVLDDVMTTGSTLNFCAKVLKEAGCKQVYGLCLFSD